MSLFKCVNGHNFFRIVPYVIMEKFMGKTPEVHSFTNHSLSVAFVAGCHLRHFLKTYSTLNATKEQKKTETIKKE